MALVFVLTGDNFSQKAQAFLLEDVFSNQIIPNHSSLEKVSENEIVVNSLRTRTIIYKANNEAGDFANIILNYYKNTFAKRGYQIVKEYSDRNSSKVSFINQEPYRSVKMTINTNKFLPGQIYVSFEITLDDAEKIGQAIQKAIFDPRVDMPGGDISWLKRYPNAVRNVSIFSEGSYEIVNYLVPHESCVQCVVEFYKEEMARNNWNLKDVHYATPEEISSIINNEAVQNDLRGLSRDEELSQNKDAKVAERKKAAQDKIKELTDNIKDVTSLMFTNGLSETCIMSIYLMSRSNLTNEQEAVANQQDVGMVSGNSFMGLRGDVKQTVAISISYMAAPKKIPRGQK